MPYNHSQRKYFKISFFVVLTILLNQAIVQYWLFQKSNDSRIINIAGRQRMLSQKINLSWYQIANGENRRQILIKDFKDWQKAHNALLYGNKELNIKAVQDIEARKILIQLNENIHQIKKGISKNTFQKNSELILIAANQQFFLLKMEKVVKKLEELSDKKLRLIIYLEIIFSIISIAMIYYKIKFYLRPIIIEFNKQKHELKKKYKELSDTKQILQSILNSTKEMIILTDENFKLLSINKTTIDIFNHFFKTKPQIGAKIFNYVPENYKKEITKGLLIALDEKSYEFEFEYSFEDKTRHYVANFYPVYTESATLLGVALNIADITKLKESETRTHQKALLYKNLYDNNKTFVIKINNEGRYLFANKHFLSSIYPKNYLYRDKKIINIIADEDKRAFIKLLSDCVENPEQSFFYTLKIPLLDGSFKYSSWEFKSENITEGEQNQILGIGFDVTELSILLAKTKTLLDITNSQNNKLQSFSYIISHNIKSHTSNLVSLLEYIENVDDSNEKKLSLDMLKTTVSKLDNTIQNLNEIILISQNINKPKEKINLKEKIEKVLDDFDALIVSKNIKVTNDVNSSITLNAIPEYLNNILYNVISNAIKYANNGTTKYIKITANKKERTLVLSVSDNGIGIDMEKNKDKLFGMYKTFHNNEDARGLGLYLTKSQIEVMGGEIKVESKLGIGSTFNLFFYEKE